MHYVRRMWQRLKSWGARRERRTALRAHVEALDEARFDGFRCVVQAGLSRVFVSRGEGDRIDVRVPADFVFDPRVAAGRGNALEAVGFTLERCASGLEWRRAQRRLVTDVEHVLLEAFGLGDDFVYSVAVEPDRAADNPDLRKAMKTLAKRRSMEARHAVYRQLVGSTLLLAVESGVPGESPRALADKDDLGGLATWLAFSGPEAVAQHEARPHHVSLSGLRLVQAALHQRIGALRLDYGSSVGGELYANELESIAEAIPAARP